MPLAFHKMHGAGNDFVLIDARQRAFELTPQQATLLADRRCGVGCDQILILREAEEPLHHLRYEIRNADGSPAGQCGNGARCIAHYLYLQGECDSGAYPVESPAGPVVLRRCPDGEYEVEMGVPKFQPQQVPVSLVPDGNSYHLETPWGALEFGAASMGNPHALVVVEHIDDQRIPEMGAFLSMHDCFPEGCNAGFVKLESSQRIRLRVIERGVGETLACGSGASAAVAILRRAGRVGDRVQVVLPGGSLVIKWRGNEETLTMKGPAVHVYRGIMNE